MLLCSFDSICFIKILWESIEFYRSYYQIMHNKSLIFLENMVFEFTNCEIIEVDKYPHLPLIYGFEQTNLQKYLYLQCYRKHVTHNLKPIKTNSLRNNR